MKNRADPLFVLFFVSGFSGLIYESVWSHYVKLFLGHAAYAQTLVLVVYIGGLALGSWLCARWTSSIANPLRAYAFIEGAIGLAALVFHRVFVATTDWGYATLLPSTCEPASAFCAGQWALSALLLAPQSILLGATFPLMSAAVIRLRESQPGHDIATLYFLNSLGAVLGVLASAFVLIPAVGLPGTLTTAGLANCAIAVAAWLLSRRAEPPPSPQPTLVEASWDWSSTRLTRVLLWTAMFTGLSSFLYEVAWIRMLSLVLGASTHSFELMLASFILGLALGGMWVRHRVDPARDPVRFLGLVQLAMGVAAAATIPVYGASFDLMAWLLGTLNRNAGGFVLFNLGSTAIALMVMLPATFCAGMTLPLITYRLLRSPTGERALGVVYAVNTVGAILGVVIAVHLLMEWVGLKATVLAGAAIDLALGVVLLASSAGEGARARSWSWAMPAVAALAVFLAFAFAFDIDPRKSASGVFRGGAARISPDDKVIFHRDGKTATVDVVESRGALAIRTNGKVDAAIGSGDTAIGDEYTMALLALLPLGHRPDARTAAVIGFGSGMSTATLLASARLERVDTIEIEPAMVEGARHFRPRVEAAYADPRSRVVIDDAKSYFARGRERYDIIVSEPSNPWVSGVASLFTQEFYERLQEYMNDGAVMSQWLHTYEMDSATLTSILKAVSHTFPDFVVYTTIDTDIVLIARKGGAAGRFQAEALGYPGLAPLLQRLKLGAPDVVERRLVGSWKTLGPYLTGSYAMPANSDFAPVVEHRASRTRFTRDRVGDLVDLLGAPIPILEMLDHGVPPFRERRELARVTVPEGMTTAAWTIHDIIMRSGPQAGAGVSEAYEISAQLVRQWSMSCRTELSFGQVFSHLLSVAELVNPGLHPEVAGTLWRRIGESACARSLDPADRLWIDLFAAVGARDAPAMAERAAQALESQRNVRGPAAEYAFMAAVTAALAQHDAARANVLLDQGTRQWLRPGQRRSELGYLFSLASARTGR
jgi:predicted membrane-bound spermidine synthase